MIVNDEYNNSVLPSWVDNTQCFFSYYTVNYRDLNNKKNYMHIYKLNSSKGTNLLSSNYIHKNFVYSLMVN